MSSHNQSHQHQPQNAAHAAQSSQTRQPSTPAVPEAKACSPGANACGCQPSAELIRARAYEISLARNGGAGNAKSDWCQAEAELSAASSVKA
jgi:hypothetical protein